MMKPFATAFIVGCGRSGTTILGDVLGRHPCVANWYEPYFIWDWHAGISDSDVKNPKEISRKSTEFVRQEFYLYVKSSGAEVVIDKTPTNCFSIPYIQTIFPDAKWIHIIRDGRDVTLSLNREWRKRQAIIERRDAFAFFDVFNKMMKSQPFWRNRFQGILFELKNQEVSFGVKKFLNKSRWKGKIGYGPRFPGWQETLEKLTVLQFNALQWVKSVEYFNRDSDIIPNRNKLEIRYESFIESPERVLDEVFDFLGFRYDPGLRLGFDLNPANRNKWKSAFTRLQLGEIGPVLTKMLMKTGYVSDSNWWNNPKVHKRFR